MNHIRPVLAALLIPVMLLTLASCSLLKKYAPAENYTTVTVENLTIDVRSDMKYDDTLTDSDGGKVYAYVCDFFGMNVTPFDATALKYQGHTAETFLRDILSGRNLQADVQPGDTVRAQYKASSGGKNYAMTGYLLDMGAAFYFIEFYTPKDSAEPYLEEYGKIISSAKPAAELPAAKEVTVSGIKMTVDGDAQDINGSYMCGRYLVLVPFVEDAANVSVQTFADYLVKDGDFVNAEGQPVKEILTVSDDIRAMEYYLSEQYCYSYIRKMDNRIVNILFMTTHPADDALKAEFANIATGAVLAEAAQ